MVPCSSRSCQEMFFALCLRCFRTVRRPCMSAYIGGEQNHSPGDSVLVMMSAVNIMTALKAAFAAWKKPAFAVRRVTRTARSRKRAPGGVVPTLHESLSEHQIGKFAHPLPGGGFPAPLLAASSRKPSYGFLDLAQNVQTALMFRLGNLLKYLFRILSGKTIHSGLQDCRLFSGV